MNFHDGRVVLHIGDCFDVLDTLPENSMDAVCDRSPLRACVYSERFANATEDDVYKNAELRKTSIKGVLLMRERQRVSWARRGITDR